MEPKGFVHSFQSMGAVDGPGIRFVVFLQGCPLRCIYCHNPDTWAFGAQTPASDCKAYTVSEVVKKILRFRPYFQHGGGVTVSGGEALQQWEFVVALFKALQEEGIHTALDTSGIGSLKGAEEVLRHTDLVLCDIKFPTEQQYRDYCKGSLLQVQAFLELVQSMKVPLWVRHVVVPGITDSDENVQQIVALAQQYSNLQRIELLPFQNLCITKYETMKIPFPLADCPVCPKETVEALQQWIPEELR